MTKSYTLIWFYECKVIVIVNEFNISPKNSKYLWFWCNLILVYIKWEIKFEYKEIFNFIKIKIYLHFLRCIVALEKNQIIIKKINIKISFDFSF